MQVATLAENPTLKAAVDTYQAEHGTANAAFRREMLATIDRELDKLAARIGPDVLAVTDPSGVVLAVAGRRGRRLAGAVASAARARTAPAPPTSRCRPGVFQFASAPLTLQDTEIGSLQLAVALDGRYAEGARDALGRGHAHRVWRRRDCEHAARRAEARS